ncbi:hypothetical protein GCM10011501_22890 [Thalassotalea profundi]|uniref:HTH tetR-type domain-containing protein n=1 Tax=Thalassotalea profundi TaxID=2036687 RepID=A0ABQ3IS47_9GAMM|nr:hypothetical protein GCM10011501_22890 [Thalassotalea profundi]
MILEVSQKLFLKKGYDETSLEMIISEAGGSRRSIYNEFGNKKGLLLAVMQQQVNIQINIIASINYELTPAQALKDMAIRFVQGLLSDTLISLYRLAIQVVPKMPEVGELIYESGPLSGITPLSDYLAYLNNKGDLAIDDCSYAAFMLIAMIKDRLHFKAALIPNVKITDQEITEHINTSVDLFIKAYKP